MHGEGFFYQAFIYLTAAVVSVPIAKRCGLGSVLGYLIAGIIIGPFGFGFIGEEGQDIMHFAEFGVVMMLFLIGLELQPSLLWRMRGPLLGMGGLQVGITTVIGLGIGMAFGLVWQSALAVGMTLALSSTAIVLQTLSEKHLVKTDAGQSSFSVLLFQDVAVIPMLAVMPLLAVMTPIHGLHDAGGHAGSNGGAWVAGLPAWAQTLVVLAVVAAIVFAGKFLARHIFRLISRTRLREIFTATALLLVIGIALLMSKVGLSPALGTFVAGVVLANNEYRHELESDIDPFKGLLLGLFFIAVGASIDFHLVASQPGFIAAMVCILIAVKFIVLFVLGRAFKMGLDQNLLFAFALSQSGEFAFVLFSFATQNGVLSEDVTNPLMAVVAISMAVTPFLILVNEKLVLPRFGTRERTQGEPDSIEEENPVIIAGFGRFGNIVGRLLTANKIKATVLEYDSDDVEVLRKLGFEVFYGDASRRDLLAAAGAEKAKLIVLAIDDHAKILEMVETIKKHFPQLTIMTRAHGRTEAYELIEAGVGHVYRDTFDTSLRMGIDALRLLGQRAFHANRSAKMFRKHDEESVRDLAQMRHDKKAYLTEARQRIKDLEQTLLSELDDEGRDVDVGWDTDSLRSEYGETPKDR
jgi:monovalent cation:proton antiporter-2 (CPA2) family protein